MPITDPGQEYFKGGAWGWNGSRWHKNPIQLGFAEIYREHVEELSAVASTDDLQSSVVPGSELWVITNIAAYDVNTDITAIELLVRDGVSWYGLMRYMPTAAGDWLQWSGRLLLGPGEWIYALFTGTVAGDDIMMNLHGYKMGGP